MQRQAIDDLPRPRMLTLMIVTGHPDDETLWAGGVMARYAEEGMRVVSVTCTGGEHGSIVAPELDTPENRARLGEIRADELTRALARLGSIENRWLGYVDSGTMGSPQNNAPRCFWQADLLEATGRLVQIVREVRPDVIVTFNEWGGNGHPDHIRAAEIARAAFDRAGDAAAYPAQLTGPNGVQPWTPSKFYERRMTAGRRRTVAQLVADDGIVAALQVLIRLVSRWRPRSERSRQKKARMLGPLDTEVDVGKWVMNKQAALAEHRTQFRSDPAELRYLAFATEHFTLRESRVEVHRPETDLFSGLRSGSR